MTNQVQKLLDELLKALDEIVIKQQFNIKTIN